MDLKILSPSEIAASWVNTGVAKANNSTGKTILLAIFAGIFIGFGGFAYLTAIGGLANTVVPAILARFIGAALFPCGLMLVIYCGSELFTGNSLLTIALLEKKITFVQLLRNWGLVYLGNFIGSFVLAWVIYKTGLIPDGSDFAASVMNVVNSKAALSISACVYRGILCNMLVVLAIWAQTASRDLIGKIAACWFPIAIFVFMGFEHSVANMFFLPLGQFLGAAASYTGMLKNILFVTVGNVIGGSCVVALSYWFIYVRKTQPDPYDPLNPPPKKKRAQK